MAVETDVCESCNHLFNKRPIFLYPLWTVFLELSFCVFILKVRYVHQVKEIHGHVLIGFNGLEVFKLHITLKLNKVSFWYLNHPAKYEAVYSPRKDFELIFSLESTKNETLEFILYLITNTFVAYYL